MYFVFCIFRGALAAESLDTIIDCFWLRAGKA
jgi:hypothetical protein